MRLGGFVALRTAALSRMKGSDMRSWWREFERSLRPPPSKEEWFAEMEAWADRHNESVKVH